MTDFDDSIFLMTNMNGASLKLFRFSGDSCNIIFICPSNRPEEMAEHLADNFASLVDDDSISIEKPCLWCGGKKCFKQQGYEPISEDDFLSIIEMVKLAPGELMLEACMDQMENY